MAKQRKPPKPQTNGELVFWQQRFVIEPYLRGYQMDVPDKYSAFVRQILLSITLKCQEVFHRTCHGKNANVTVKTKALLPKLNCCGQTNALSQQQAKLLYMLQLKISLGGAREFHRFFLS